MPGGLAPSAWHNDTAPTPRTHRYLGHSAEQSRACQHRHGSTSGPEFSPGGFGAQIGTFLTTVLAQSSDHQGTPSIISSQLFTGLQLEVLLSVIIIWGFNQWGKTYKKRSELKSRKAAWPWAEATKLRAHCRWTPDTMAWGLTCRAGCSQARWGARSQDGRSPCFHRSWRTSQRPQLCLLPVAPSNELPTTCRKTLWNLSDLMAVIHLPLRFLNVYSRTVCFGELTAYYKTNIKNLEQKCLAEERWGGKSIEAPIPTPKSLGF